jgi:hypothetical protein
MTKLVTRTGFGFAVLVALKEAITPTSRAMWTALGDPRHEGRLSEMRHVGSA